MCLIVEHAHLKKRIQELEAELHPVVPDYPIFKVPWQIIVSELNALNIECMLKKVCIPDSYIYHTDEAGWNGIIPFLTFPADMYVSIVDCDDYARKATSDSAWLFGLNGCLECWGNITEGYHAFNLVRIGEKEYRLFEPNAGFPWAGELFKIGENGYQPKYWRL